MLLRTFSIFILCLVAGCASIPEKLTKLNDNNYRIIGKLDKPEYDTIIEIVSTHPNEAVNFYVTSHGGTSHNLVAAMDAVYYHGNVNWYSVDRCDSACAVMALSSKHAHGEFRLHSFHPPHSDREAPEFNRVILRRLELYGYQTKSIAFMFEHVNPLWEVTIVDGMIVFETAHEINLDN